jgi:hypothetical protein
MTIVATPDINVIRSIATSRSNVLKTEYCLSAMHKYANESAKLGGEAVLLLP